MVILLSYCKDTKTFLIGKVFINMSTSKKRHIQESNLILEKRLLQTEGLFIERSLPEDLINNSLKLASLISPNKSSIFNSLLSNQDKNKYKKWSNRKIIFDSLQLSDKWCKNKTSLSGLSQEDSDKFPCIKVNDYIVGESDSMLTGYLGIFGKLTS
jgi:hypothetical protein